MQVVLYNIIFKKINVKIYLLKEAIKQKRTVTRCHKPLLFRIYNFLFLKSLFKRIKFSSNCFSSGFDQF